MTAPTPQYGRRLAAVRAAMADAGLDALLVTHPPNLRYLAGFDGSLGALFVTPQSCRLVVDGRYLTAARTRLAGVADLRDVGVVLAERSLEEAVAAAVWAGGPPRSLGVEAAALTVSRFDAISRELARAAGERPAPALRPTERLVERIRAVKDAAEIAILREAARRLSEVARAAPGLVAIGRSERDVAADLDHALRRAGFERPAFETIVASGPNSALPHARPTSRPLAAGDGVVLDFGGVYDGYCVDLTRTLQLPPVTESFAGLLAAVREAQEAAIGALRPGAACSQVDEAARSVLTARGLGEAFLHGTGHGLGLEVHEAPRIAREGAGADQLLEPGMVVTIEPGVYVPGLGGVRLEDDLLVVRGGCERLTDVPIDRAGWGLWRSEPATRDGRRQADEPAGA